MEGVVGVVGKGQEGGTTIGEVGVSGGFVKNTLSVRGCTTIGSISIRFRLADGCSDEVLLLSSRDKLEKNGLLSAANGLGGAFVVGVAGSGVVPKKKEGGPLGAVFVFCVMNPSNERNE